MKKLLLLALALVSIVALAVAGDANSPNWQPLPEIKTSSVKVFYDASSLKREEQVGTGFILVSFASPQTLYDSSGRSVVVQSVVKKFVINCKSAIMAPMAELYFNVAMPDLTSTVVASVEYDASSPKLAEITRTSIFYNLLCGVRV